MDPSSGSCRLPAARRTRSRAGPAIVKMNTIRISVSAAPHARSWAPGNSERAFRKICSDSAVFAAVEQAPCWSRRPVPTVKSSGAVSPAARATASSAPLDDPGAAVGQHDACGSCGPSGSRARSCPRGARAARATASGRWCGSRSAASGTPAPAHPRTPFCSWVLQHHERVDEQAHHDRRDAGHHLGQEADEPGERTRCRRTR